jgi:hypothetical protein
MSRLDHFVSLVDRPRVYLSLTGFALPIVGGILGMFSAMLLLSNLLNVSIGDSHRHAQRERNSLLSGRLHSWLQRAI